jgi:hypothetical protein
LAVAYNDPVIEAILTQYGPGPRLALLTPDCA